MKLRWNPVLDLRNPARLYPQARKLRRKVVLHIGPTNSGKSYNALQAFKASKSGFYAGPLRMLAREVYDRMRLENIACNLVTGDECIQSPKVSKYSGTVEMIDLNSKFEVAVLDEIQMISDPSRGWAWSQAFLGVQAKELHLCGDANSENIIRELVQQTGDELQIKHYKRLSPLRMDNATIKPKTLLKKLEPGDCIVCFSARKVKALRDEIVQKLGRKCAVIYGSLPPETRAKQAQLFNDPESDVDFLVASDAIGMGLNLAIKRVIIYDLAKFDGESMIELPVAQIKQIAGRAGRYKAAPTGLPKASDPDTTQAEGGLVNTLAPAAKKVVAEALKAKSPEIKRALLQPTSEAVRSFVLDKTGDFTMILKQAFDIATIGPSFEKTRTEPIYEVTALVDDIRGLTLDDRITLGNAPVKKTPIVQNAFKSFCKVIANRESKTLLETMPQLSVAFDASTEIVQLEDIHKCITLFQWMSIRYPCNLLDQEGASDLKTLCEYLINKRLQSRRSLSAGAAGSGTGSRGPRKPSKRHAKSRPIHKI